MSILKRLRDKREGNLATVKYMIGGEEIDMDAQDGVINGLVRKTMRNMGKKFQKKYAHLVHPETGERPDIVVDVPNPKKPAAHVRLVTDSEQMREWLKAKGIVIGEVAASDTAA